jgi:hypothetical protein
MKMRGSTTSPFVDQSQTYSSHRSFQVFLRAYELLDTDRGEGVNLVPFATGGLITNRDPGGDGTFGTADDVEIGGMAAWAALKAHARELRTPMTSKCTAKIPPPSGSGVRLNIAVPRGGGADADAQMSHEMPDEQRGVVGSCSPVAR